MKDKLSLWERYLSKEIGIEFKACLYFFALLFYYCMYKVCCGIYTASILHMAELILLCYLMGYIQVYLLGNFDEADRLGGREITGLLISTGIYTLLAWVFGWFDRKLPVTAGFAAYVAFVFVCAFLVYRRKRRIDDKKLNDDLNLFQTRNRKVPDDGE